MLVRGNEYFLLTPRCASRACMKALLPEGFTLYQNKMHRVGPIPDGASVHAIVRNPYDWLVSLWRMHKRRGLFDNWVKGLKTNNGVFGYKPLIRNGDIFWNVRKANLIRYEDASCEMERLFGVQLERVGVSNRGTWESMFYPTLKRWVAENYAPSFQPFYE